MSLPVVTLIAGEASGDTYGAELMRSLLKQLPELRFMGLGGSKMAEVARTTKGEVEDWTAEAGVVGLWDVLKKYTYFRRHFNKILKHLSENPPAAIILIDYPGFNLRLAKAIRARQLPISIFYFISPQVWAWHRGRISTMARLLDVMLCIFPFEKKLYEASGLPTVFVGHPLVEKLLAPVTQANVVPRQERLLGLFPGSRNREVHHLFPTMIETARQVMAADPTVRCEAAAATSLQADLMQAMAAKAGVAITITSGQSYELMQRATFGIVCSGTATLEAACFGLPYVLVYKAAWLTYVVARAVIRVPYLGIINILAERSVVKELLQHEATVEKLTQEALRFLHHPEACHELSIALQKVVATLDGHGAYDRAAKEILDHSTFSSDRLQVES